MMQDTRKDPRAKVLSMTVRYKSATLDEFIEHHSHDISRGGMFIKTPSPFPPGTLLKFEVKIAEEQRLMQGVGRVVWKRESPEASGDRPAGMGVKFIKIDEPAKQLIDQLITRRADAGTAFEEGRVGVSPEPVPPATPVPPAMAPAAPQPSTPAGAMAAPRPGTPAGGIAATRPVTPLGTATPAAFERAAPVAARAETGGPVRKATMLGLGLDSGAGAAKSSEVEAFFPKTSSEEEMPPPEDRTVMRQAAEVLQDALRGAGGSMEEVAGDIAPKQESPLAPSAAADAPVEDKVAARRIDQERALDEAWGEEVPSPTAQAGAKEEAKPEAAEGAESEPPPAKEVVAPAPAAIAAASERKSKPEPISERKPRETPSAVFEEPERAKGSGKMIMLLLAVAAAALVLFFLTRKRPEAPAPEPPKPKPAPAASAAPAPTPTEQPAPTAQAPAVDAAA
ncbi:MAG TPA: TIGR02266 family protein, partial [Polyangiaceae bacterium]